MSGSIFVPIVRVRNVGFLAIVRNVICTNCRSAEYLIFHQLLGKKVQAIARLILIHVKAVIIANIFE